MTLESEKKEASDMPGAQILLVEDDEILRSVIERNLLARGYVVRVATDAEGALAWLRTYKFDLVLLDINLPDQTGWDVLRIARATGDLFTDEELLDHRLPVVVLSAVRVSPHRLAEFRPFAYLPKPFPMDALLRLVFEVTQKKYVRVDRGR